MHIPDGYISPATCAVGDLAALPMWATASRKVTKVVKTRNLPTLAVFATLNRYIFLLLGSVTDMYESLTIGATMRIASDDRPAAGVLRGRGTRSASTRAARSVGMPPRAKVLTTGVMVRRLSACRRGAGRR
jgi:hypothetical protein